LFQSIDRALGKNAQRGKRWAKLNRYQRAVHSWGYFRRDVENGGLALFFYNHNDALVSSIHEALGMAGAESTAKLLERATAIYRQHYNEFAVDDPFVADGIFARVTELKKLDQLIGRQMKSANQRLEKWVRAHIAQVAVEESGNPIDPKFTGSIETFYPDGNVREQAVVRIGILSSPNHQYREDGSLEHSGYYRQGAIATKQGPGGHPDYAKWEQGELTIEEWYYPSGRLQKRSVADRNGDAVGIIRFWHENGRLAEEMHVTGGNNLGP
jgi:hypothetical protein